MLTVNDVVDIAIERLHDTCTKITGSILPEPVNKRDFSYQQLENQHAKGCIFVYCNESTSNGAGSEQVNIVATCIATSHANMANLVNAVRWSLVHYHPIGFTKRFEFVNEVTPEHEDGILMRVVTLSCSIPSIAPDDAATAISNLGL